MVVGGGAAGVYAAIRAKNIAPHLGVLVLEKGKFLSKVSCLSFFHPIACFFSSLAQLVHAYLQLELMLLLFLCVGSWNMF